VGRADVGRDTGRCRQRVVASARGVANGAGWPAQRFTRSRHGAASALIASGGAREGRAGDARALSYGITADIYSHINIEQQCEAADRLGRRSSW
jgi:hypothetical protein